MRTFSSTLCILLLGSLASTATASEKWLLRGTVRDAATGESLSAANVRVLGTSLGTITNTQGNYSLGLDAGSYLLSFSMLGYRPDTARVVLGTSTRLDISLEPSDIVLPEIVVTSEDPALEIIRRAIANKKRWIDRLVSYEMDAFTRQVLWRDTSIASITESFTRGYWQQGDTLREIITQKRQTANINIGSNFASVGRILNFNEDRIRFLGYTFVGPTATDAFDYYDYHLLRTRSSHGHEVYEIRMTPRSRATPLFEGTVSIANGSYALVGVDVSPNDAFVIPFVKDRTVRYRQQFALYDSTFWMPVDIRIDGAFSIGVIGLSFPRIRINQTSVISRYAINVVIPDSIFRKPRLSVDSTAARFDSTQWADSTSLPLSTQEQEAYRKLDSTQTLEVQFRPGGITATIGGEAGFLDEGVRYLDIAFNRVEGLHAGVSVDAEKVLPVLGVRAGWAYGFSDKRAKYNFGATLFTSAGRVFGIGADVYRVMDHRPESGYYGSLFNSFTALFVKNDYRDYYEAEGWETFCTVTPVRLVNVRLSFTAESQRSVNQRTNYSIVYPSRQYRDNPPIIPGRLRSMMLFVRLGEEPVPLELVSRNAVELRVERSTPGFASSQFDFSRYEAVATFSVPTFGSSFLFRPELKMRIAAGGSSGTIPPQRLFGIESQSSSFAPFGVMRALRVKEFSGTSYAAINIEENFRTLPFLALGIPFLYKNNLELVVHGGAAHSWNSGPYVIPVTSAWYTEAGVGLSRILELFRVDATWRLSAPTRFCVTISAASIL